MKTCWLAGAGDFFAEGFRPEQGDMIIAVDGGYEKLKELGFVPDVVTGDFDSLGYVPEGDKINKHPCRKDDTDMMLAVNCGIEAGCDSFMLFGGTGGRISHTLGNIQVLVYLARQGKKGQLCDRERTVSAVGEGSCTLKGSCKDYISLLPWGCENARVSIKGLEYELDCALLPCDRPLGISNEFTGREAVVTVHEGTVIIVTEHGARGD